MIADWMQTLLIIVIYGLGFGVLVYASIQLRVIDQVKTILEKRNKQKKAVIPLYNVIIIGSRSHYYYKTETSAEIIEIKHKNRKYKARKDQAYREDYNFLEKLFNDRKCEYTLIFYELTEEQLKEKTTPTSVRPVDINTKTENKQFITANLLYRVWKYRGVKPAFKDEFKEPSSFNVPTWAIVVVVLVFVVVGGFIAYQAGVLELALSSFNNTKAVNPI